MDTYPASPAMLRLNTPSRSRPLGSSTDRSPNNPTVANSTMNATVESRRNDLFTLSFLQIRERGTMGGITNPRRDNTRDPRQTWTRAATRRQPRFLS